VTSGPATAIRNSCRVTHCPVHERDAAEHPQVDPRDADAAADRRKRVPKLVKENRREEEQRAGNRQRVRAGVAAMGAQDVPVEPRQPEDEQEQDEEPADIDANSDAANVQQGIDPPRMGSSSHTHGAGKPEKGV